jgi:glycosyltransferase involved in cell wall biosynthesis
MSDLKLSIVIISLNEEIRLPLLLDDLSAQTWKDFEIVHVDSNSDDSTVELSRQRASDFETYRVVTMPARGVSLGRNTGAALATGNRILFLDGDTRLPADFLQNALQELDTQAIDVGVVCMSADCL